MPQGCPRPVRLLLLLTWMVLPVCADHPREVRAALDGLRANRLAAVDRVFLKDASRSGTDRLLALYELAGCYHLAGEFGRSRDFFNQADAVAQEYEGQAMISEGVPISCLKTLWNRRRSSKRTSSETPTAP